jgi:hypothetical protein
VTSCTRTPGGCRTSILLASRVEHRALFDLRFLPLPCRNWILTPEIREINSSLRWSMIRRLMGYILDINTKTYGNIYYNVKTKTVASQVITSYNCLIRTYAPLLELEVVRCRFGL